MRNFIRERFRRALRFIAILTIKKYKPGIIGIAGAAGKTSAKEAIFSVMRGVRRTRAAQSGGPNEIVFLLAILGVSEYRPSFGFWLKVFFKSLIQLAIKFPYPEVLVLEYSIDRPGGMRDLLNIARPQIGVLTNLGPLPPQLEFFDGPEEVFREVARLIEALPALGFAVLNADDPDVMKMKERTRAHVVTYGFSSVAEFSVTGFEYRRTEGRLSGVAFKIDHSGSFVPIRSDGTIGRGAAYAIAAAAAVGAVFGAHLVKVAEAVSYFSLPQHSSALLSGELSTTIIDDSFNAAPISMKLAFETIAECGRVRKIGVVGEMTGLGKYAVAAHEEVGKQAAHIFDFLIVVGPRARFIADAAIKSGMSRRNVFRAESADDAIITIKKILKRRDIVLVKGSAPLRLDRVVAELQVKPELKSDKR